MKILNSLSIPFYEFHCDPNLLDEIKVRVENLNYITDENKEAEFSKNYFYYEPLINWFDECLEQVRKIYYKWFGNNCPSQEPSTSPTVRLAGPAPGICFPYAPPVLVT